MAQILIRDLDASLVERLKKRAAEEGRSLQAEVKLILERAAYDPRVDMETARKISEEFLQKFKGRQFPDTVELLHEDHLCTLR